MPGSLLPVAAAARQQNISKSRRPARCAIELVRPAGAIARPSPEAARLPPDFVTAAAQAEGIRRRSDDSPRLSSLRRSPTRDPPKAAINRKKNWAGTPDRSISSIHHRGFESELPTAFLGSHFRTWNNRIAGRVMEDDASRFRQYAAQCRRLAERAMGKDKAILMEIAGAWITCAEEVERKQKTKKGRAKTTQ